jgi:hypothetical protein
MGLRNKSADEAKSVPNIRAHLKRLWAALPALESIAKGMTAPFCWEDVASDQPSMKGGTICFVHTGTRLLGISAAHIHRAYEQSLSASSQLWCQIGGYSFQPVEHLLDIDDRFDLVTYGLSEIEVVGAGGSIHQLPTWPPKASSFEDAYLVGGWPWELNVHKPRATTHRFLHYLTRLVGSAHDELTILIDRPNSHPWGSWTISVETNIGGLSGGPILQVVETPVTHVRLVGISRGIAFEAVTGRPLSLIQEDGTIVRGAVT